MLKSASLVVLLAFALLCSGTTLPKRRSRVHGKGKSAQHSNDIATPCSTNLASLYVDILLLIDVSTNNHNVQEVSSTLNSVLSKALIGEYEGAQSSRVAIITYSDEATVVARLNESNADVSKNLASLTSSNSNSSAGIANAFNLANEVLIESYYYGQHIARPVAFVFVGASLYGVDIDKLYDTLYYGLLDSDTVITINANPDDWLLTSVFDSISSPSGDLNVNDPKLSDDLSFAFTQANCYCGYGEQNQLYIYNWTSNRYEKTADCFVVAELDGSNGIPAYDQCYYYGLDDALVTSPQKEYFIEGLLYYYGDNYYIGLHRNYENNWVTYDHDGYEVPLGDYQPWAPGFDANSTGDCVTLVAYYEDFYGDYYPVYYWLPTDCYPQSSSYCYGYAVVNAVCQVHACDADNVHCNDYYYNQLVKTKETIRRVPSRKAEMQHKMAIKGKLQKMKKPGANKNIFGAKKPRKMQKFKKQN